MFRNDNNNEENEEGFFTGFNFTRGFNLSSFMSSNLLFRENYRVFPIEDLPGPSRINVTYGGKIILPQSALMKMSSFESNSPMLFELSMDERYSFAGVLEFIAEEGRVYIPNWMMISLNVEKGDIIEVNNTTLPKGKFVKIQPQSVDFLDITDPKAVLENTLRNFSCLTQGEIITINYNDHRYDILIKEIKPEGRGISIIDTDLEVDFDTPLGYVEPERPSSSRSIHNTAKIEQLEQRKEIGWKAFSGQGNQISIRRNNRLLKNKKEDEEESKEEEEYLPPVPLNLPAGNLFFGYRYIPPFNEDKEGKNDKNLGSTFSGSGHTFK